MDIARPDIKKKKVRRQVATVVVVVLVAAAAAAAVFRLKPAAPTVDASTIWPDTVKRGPMIRQVHGLGTLVPREDRIRLIPSQTEATVTRIRVLPGTKVQADTILMDLTDPQLQQELLDAQLQLKAAQVDYHNLQVKLESELMDKRAAAATVTADSSQAQLQAQTDSQLYKLGVISGLAYNKSKSTADELNIRNKIGQEQVDMNQKAIETQLQVQQTKVEQAKAMLELRQNEQNALEVRAGIDGVLIDLPHQVGEHVAPGTTLAKVVQPDQLKAELKIAETQAHDIQLDQPAEIDTHNGIVPGHVNRIDPAVVNGTRTVDVVLDGPLPPGAVPDLSVDGTIDLNRLKDVLYVGRPAFGNENSTISLFRIDPDGKYATRVQVKVGMASVTQIQVLEGLKEGDRVILSDMSRYDNTDRVRLE
ncbi:efflux RND transporter periplasmic adaptor subunit [Acidipila rosea]|uniref:RND family efflux transporter MFP subunit n=1 Tax=Acidipila rosea TaxID=768535 RepID=A0A4R1LAB7_9BACT|nr:efflux RND transporter periplasmic adaptor subunit [Acidipila rosea]MBW4026931.1 efflux RND transporter periplasmic adaptor subunit [Acidobacteriota bacterium]MBW4044999.1 efflux RND transporter periplasmic adaptor subunit [Acidobacteriota bacterium]TCK75232.1 RND family efflux transporter MFP subunit [Acidipila rosea]